MGSQFFAKAIGHPAPISSGNLTPLARATGSGQYGARAAGIAETKALAGAQAANKAAIGAHKPAARSSAYPKGPKI